MDAAYWLYLPEGYDQRPPGDLRTRYPLVVTFHGMKPFDDDGKQIREWQQEADRYGFVVCAPTLRVAAFSAPLPLEDPNNAALKRDEQATLAILDEVNRIADVDPNKVLATSWSYGGYVAHFMFNRHPERFTCLAVKQSNFNADILEPANVPRYRDRKIGIFYTENDFKICRRESHQAAEWYARQGFDLTFAVFEKQGHERTPGVAAEFFARVIGAEPKTPPIELARMQVIPQPVPHGPDGTPPPAANFAPPPAANAPPRPINADVVPRSDGSSMRTAPRSPSTPATGRAAVLRSTPVPPPESSLRVGTDRRPPDGAVRIKIDPMNGAAPLVVRYSAIVPEWMRTHATATWFENGVPLSNGLNGQTVLDDPGQHAIELLVTARDGRDYRATTTVAVTGAQGPR